MTLIKPILGTCFCNLAKNVIVAYIDLMYSAQGLSEQKVATLPISQRLVRNDAQYLSHGQFVLQLLGTVHQKVCILSIWHLSPLLFCDTIWDLI